MKNSVMTFLATGAYAGRIPFAPGTFGTLWGAAIALAISPAPVWGQAIVTAFVILASIYIAGQASKASGNGDHPSIVIDEVAGYLVSVFLIPVSALNIILVFIIFRFFDILKPYPASLADRSVKGGFGIVLDDLIAGVYANVTANVIIWLAG